MSFFDDLDELLEGEPTKAPPETKKEKTPPTKKPRKQRTTTRKKPQEELERLQRENQELKNEIQSLRSQLKSKHLVTSIPAEELPDEDTHSIEVEIPVGDKNKIITDIKRLETTKNAASISALLFIAKQHPDLVSEEKLDEKFFCRKKYIRNVFRKRYAQTQEGDTFGKPVEHHLGLLIAVTQQGEVHYHLSTYGEKFFQLYFDYFKKENVITRIRKPRFAHLIHNNDILMYRFVHNRFAKENKLTLREDLWELSFYQIAESAKNLIGLGLLAKEISPKEFSPGTTCWRPRYPDITPDLLSTV